MMSDYESTHTTDGDEDDQFHWPPEAFSRASSAFSSTYSTPSRTPGGADDGNDNVDDGGEDDDVPQFGLGPAAIAPTAFDAYFLHASKPARTSSHVFSQLVPPLSPEDYAAALARAAPPPIPALWQDGPLRAAFFAQWAAELHAGFNLLFYGYGSKREVLNAFGRALAKRTRSRRGGHVLVVNGFQPSCGLKDVLGAIEQIPFVQEALEASSSASTNASSAGTDAQTQRIYDIFSTESEGGQEDDPDTAHLYLVIHNIDGPGLRTTKAKAVLSRLALAPRIHIIASIDHIAAPSRWTLSELFARKAAPSSRTTDYVTRNDKGKARADAPPEGGRVRTSTVASAHAVPRRGFAWLWHDLTTLAPYDFELAGADPSSLSSSTSGTRRLLGVSGVATSVAATQIVTESAARHVLASVTQKARKLFALLGGKQLELMADAASSAAPAPGVGSTTPRGAETAYDYARLFNAARDEFVATSDAALRALLAEFRDHGVVVSVMMPATGLGGGGHEALWIPMRRDALARLVGELQAEGG